jgi:phosphopantetheinyl transferase
MVILDRETLSPEGNHRFTPRELAKSLRMGPQRQKSFTASRIALKNLSRQLGLVKEKRSDCAIETLGPDDQRPCLADSGVYCSVSHSSRFVVAVAHGHPVGVDIEEVSNKILRIEHLFLSPGEQKLLSQTALDFNRAATRVWSIKEAAAKALGLHLFQAIREVEVIKMEKEKTTIRVQEKTYLGNHGEGEGQVIALVTCNDL